MLIGGLAGQPLDLGTVSNTLVVLLFEIVLAFKTPVTSEITFGKTLHHEEYEIHVNTCHIIK